MTLQRNSETERVDCGRQRKKLGNRSDGTGKNYVHGLTNKSVVLVAALLRHRDRHTLTAPPSTVFSVLTPPPRPAPPSTLPG